MAGNRRLVRVVEGARLESVYTGNCIEGSNPSVSASGRHSFSDGDLRFQFAPGFICGRPTADRSASPPAIALATAGFSLMSQSFNLATYGGQVRFFSLALATAISAYYSHQVLFAGDLRAPAL